MNIEYLIEEERQLGERIVKVNNIIHANESYVDYDELMLISAQHSAMLGYRKILNIRINKLKNEHKNT